jgi:hypothetical protein
MLTRDDNYNWLCACVSQPKTDHGFGVPCRLSTGNPTANLLRGEYGVVLLTCGEVQSLNAPDTHRS